MKERQINSRSDCSSEAQRECWDLFADLVCGEHHMLGRVYEWHDGLRWNMRPNCGGLSTFDFDGLTRLVLMAHDRCIRVEIVPSGPGMLGISAFKRLRRDGETSRRHPTIETAIQVIRNGRERA